MSTPVQFNRPCFVGKELAYVTEAVAKHKFAGDGSFTQACSEFLERELGVAKVLLTTSCTHAIELSALLLDIAPGDEVLLPSFTFVSTANAFVLRGARPVFVDVRRDTLNLDEQMLTRHITKRTRVVVPVHYGGIACELDTIGAIAREAGLLVIEDNAHGLFGRYKGRPLGSFGTLAVQSFHETKNYTCGEGGALVINDPRLVERAEIIRNKGTDQKRFLRGEIDKYTWCDVGSSYLPSDLLAAILLAQLEQREEIQARRQRIFEHYDEVLRPHAARWGVTLPTIPVGCQPAYHVYYLLLPGLAQRQALMAHLKALDIASAFHYQPLHLSEMGRRFGYIPGDCPVTEEVSECILRLPCHGALTTAEQDRVIEAIIEFFTT